MTGGTIIVIGCSSICLALVCYGLYFDAKRWLERHGHASDLTREQRRRWQDADQRARVAQILATRDWELECLYRLPAAKVDD